MLLDQMNYPYFGQNFSRWFYFANFNAHVFKDFEFTIK